MKLILTLIFSLFFVRIQTNERDNAKEFSKQIKKQISYNKLVKAVYLHESGGNPEIVGPTQDYGLFQITPIRLRDFNIRAHKNYKIQDLYNPIISREIFDFYAYQIGIEHLSKIARQWHRGPSNWKDSKGDVYWKYITKQLNRLS